MFPIKVNTSLKRYLSVGNTVYDSGAWKCTIVEIKLFNSDSVERAKLEDIKTVSIISTDPVIQSFGLSNKPMPFTVNEIFLKKSDALAYAESSKAAWNAYKKFGYETLRRKHKISIRKNQVSLKLLPYSKNVNNLERAIQSMIRYTYKGKNPYAFKVTEKDLILWVEDDKKAVITLPFYIEYRDILDIIQNVFDTNLNVEIYPNIVFYL